MLYRSNMRESIMVDENKFFREATLRALHNYHLNSQNLVLPQNEGLATINNSWIPPKFFREIIQQKRPVIIC